MRKLAIIAMTILAVMASSINSFAVQTYQNWNGFPDSPLPTVEFPFQVIIGSTLIMSKTEIWGTSTRFFTTDPNGGTRSSSWNGTAWSTPTNLWAGDHDVMTGSINPATVQCNYDVYESYYRNVLFKAKTTVPPPPVDLTQPFLGVMVVPLINGVLSDDGDATVSKTLEWQYQIRVPATSGIDMLKYELAVTDITLDPLLGNPDLKSLVGQPTQLTLNGATVADGVGKISGKFRTVYQDNFTGLASVSIQVTNTLDNTFYVDTAFIHIDAFVDSDSDGLDDITGEPPYNPPGGGLELDGGTKPNKADYTDDIFGNIKYGFDMVLYYITAPFVWIGESLADTLEWLSKSMGWITQVSAFFSAFFGFLPTEVTEAMGVIVTVIVIFSVLKVIRG